MLNFATELPFKEDAQEEFGWKLVHGDVFRPPRKGMLLSVFLGSGTQIFIMTFVTLCMFLLSMFFTVSMFQSATPPCTGSVAVNLNLKSCRTSIQGYVAHIFSA